MTAADHTFSSWSLALVARAITSAPTSPTAGTPRPPQSDQLNWAAL
jgi:hypothetical protein